MKKQSRNSSMQTSAKYKIPKIKGLNHSSVSTTSPSNSFFSNFNQPLFSLGPLLGLRNYTKLNKKPIQVHSKGKSGERSPEDIEYFDEYRKFELKKSRKLVDEKFPFWFLDSLDSSIYPSPQEDPSSLQFTENDRKGFCSWSENLLSKIKTIEL